MYCMYKAVYNMLYSILEYTYWIIWEYVLIVCE